MEREIYDQLFACAFTGDSEGIHELENIDDALYERSGLSIIHTESMEGGTERVQFVLKEFANKNLLFRVDSEKQTALHLATSYGQAEVVQILIDEARHLPAPSSSAGNSCLVAIVRQANDSMNTALHLAVTNGDMVIAKLLVEADPDGRHIQNDDGETPIYIAAKKGYVDILRMILTTCTHPTFDGPDGTTALHAAITGLPEQEYARYNVEDSVVVEILIDAIKRFSSSESFSFEGFIAQADNKCKNTALHLAVLGNHRAVVQKVARITHKYDEKNSDQKVPIYIAAEQGYNNIVKILCPYFSSWREKSGPGDRTVLHGAIIGRDTDCVKFVMKEAGFLVNFCDHVGWTPLHYAAYYKFDSVLDMIVEAHVSFGFRPRFKGIVPTPLWLATKEGHISTVIQLIKLLPGLCAEINHDDGRNVLHLAAFQGDKEMVQTILKFCPEAYIYKLLNDKDRNKDTPLHLLISRGCFVAELIKHEAVYKLARNKQNWTPFDMLYIQEEVIADQLQIKKALDDDTQANHNWKFWRKSSKLKSNTQESLVPPKDKSRKDVAFKNAKRELLTKVVELNRERTNTQIIVTALITTVTFTVGFTMPGGYYQSGQLNQGMVLLSKKPAFIAFMVSDALALALSATTLFLYFVSSMYEDPRHVSKLIVASAVLNIISVIAMMMTFIAGTYAVLSHSPILAITVCIICSTFFLSIIALLIKMRSDRNKLEDVTV